MCGMNLNSQQTYEYIRKKQNILQWQNNPTEVAFAHMSSRKLQTVHLTPYHAAYKYKQMCPVPCCVPD